jgi:two-component system chemotaxis sensor kinase CheA
VAVAVTTVLDIADDDPAQHSEIDDGGVVGLTVLEGRVTELLDVRRAVLSADSSFFDDDVADDPSAWNTAHTAVGPGGV